ncbi:MAG: efflux transporter outer membrane subunit, partial [Pseudomonadota bacterium]|nr:efflux transporter outer membrane subunit [Pseudomonadota bacterium]
HDLAAAVARIEQARASARSARAALLPTVGAAASASRDRRSEDGTRSYSEDAQASVSIGYELDLFGGNRATANAAAARLASVQFSRDEVLLVLQADVANTWFQWLAFNERLEIGRENLRAAEELLRLVTVRFDNGAVSALDVAQQRTTTLNIRAQIPLLEQSVVETRNALAVLLGRAPQDFSVPDSELAALALPRINPGQPASLLLRRPDIRGAEADLIAANADIGAARAALLPSLNISASSAALGLLDGGTTTVSELAASLAQTLFAGGRLRSQLALSEATRTELVERYVQTVLVGLQEVENSLSAVGTGEQREMLLVQTAEQAREAYRLASVRYDSGAEDLLTVLDSLRSRLSADDSLIQARLARYVTSTTLVKALGGGWEPAAP